MAPISGQYNFRDPSMYMNHASGITRSIINNGGNASAGIGNYLNGQMSSMATNTVNGVADELMGNMNPYAKMAVKSALSILMSWVMGQDKKEAAGAKTEGLEKSGVLRGDADSGVAASNELRGNAASDNDALVSDILDNRSQIDSRNENNQELNNDNDEQKKKIDDLRKEQKKLLDDIQKRQDALKTQQVNLPKKGENNGDDGEKGVPPTTLSSDNVTDPVLVDLLKQYNDIGAQITEIQTVVDQNNTQIETNLEENDTNYQNMDAAADQMISLYQGYQSAIQNVGDLVSGKQKMFTPEMMIKAAEQIAMSAINGTEGGVLAAAATAMGASSVFSFGTTAAEAAKYARASADKFSSVAPRIASSVAIKLAKTTAESYIQQALANISQIAGVDLTQIYNMGMDIYNQASADNPNKGKDDAGEEPEADKPKTDEPKTDKPKTDNPQQA